MIMNIMKVLSKEKWFVDYIPLELKIIVIWKIYVKVRFPLEEI